MTYAKRTRRVQTPRLRSPEIRGREAGGTSPREKRREKRPVSVHVTGRDIIGRLVAWLAHRVVARAKSHELVRLQRVGTPLLGRDGWPIPRSSRAVAFCSCGLALVAPTDAAAEHAHDRHQADPAQVWIR